MLFISLIALFSALVIGGWCALGIVLPEEGPQPPYVLQSGRLMSLLQRKSSYLMFISACLIAWLVVLVSDLDRALPQVIAVLIVFWSVPGILRRFQCRRRQRRMLAALPDALSQMASSMQAGATLNTAMRWYIDESSGPLTEELSFALREHRLGTRLEDALNRLGERVDLHEMDLVICALLVARETGGNLVDVLSQLSSSVRQQLELTAKISALTSQGVLQGWIVSLLPLLIILALYVLEPAAVKPLFSSLLGWVCLAAITFLELSGALMIWRIVKIDV